MAPSRSLCLLLLCASSPAPLGHAVAQERSERPNIVLFFTDDQGYGDLSCYGHPSLRTPNLDALAASGTKLTQFYVACPVCSPSRAALLTGCYPKRVGMHQHVVYPPDDYGLHPDERTLAEVLSERGYATGCFGKWHLGHRVGMLPNDQGFDRFVGVPYSNDMSQFHRRADNDYRFRLPWIVDGKVVEWEPDQHEFTRRTVDAVVEFVEQHAERPFFAYVPFSMPHIPIYASAEFEGRSPRGLYGDVIEEIDAGVGRVLATLAEHGLRERTLVLFSSDNGPWLSFEERGGSAGPLRGGKGTNWEGGQRVPFLASWPGTLPAGRVETAVVTAMDVLPTLAALAGAELSAEPRLDGRDLSAFLLDPDAPAPVETPFLYYAAKGPLAGIRRGPWKLLLDGPKLFHLEHDISEERNVAEKHPELVTELEALARELDAQIEAEARPVLREERLVFDPARPG